MGSPSSVETFVPAEDPQRGSPTPSAPFRRIAVCVDGSEMSEVVVLHAAHFVEDGELKRAMVLHHISPGAAHQIGVCLAHVGGRRHGHLRRRARLPIALIVDGGKVAHRVHGCDGAGGREQRSNEEGQTRNRHGVSLGRAWRGIHRLAGDWSKIPHCVVLSA